MTLVELFILLVVWLTLLSISAFLASQWSSIKQLCSKHKFDDSYETSWVLRLDGFWNVRFYNDGGIGIGCKDKTKQEWDYFFSWRCFRWYSTFRYTPKWFVIRRDYKEALKIAKQKGWFKDE